MEIGSDKIKFIEDMITALTLKRILLLCLFAAISIIMLAVFENRASLFAKLYKTSSPHLVEWALSNESKAQLTSIVDYDTAGGIIFYDVDLKKNQKNLKFFRVNNEENSPEVAALIVQISRLQPHSLFDADPKNIDQMVSMLNNEFKCVGIQDSSLIKILPAINQKFAFVCRMAVPPYFGEFLGYLEIGLTKAPSDYELDALRIEINKIAIELYVRDVTNRTIKSPTSK